MVRSSRLAKSNTPPFSRRTFLRSGVGFSAAAATLLHSETRAQETNATETSMALQSAGLEPLYSEQTKIVPMANLYCANHLPGWVRNGSPSYAFDIAAAAASGYFGTTSPDLYGAPETAYSLNMLKPNAANWSESVRIRILPYPDTASANAARDALQQNAVPAGAMDISTVLASQIEGASLAAHTGDISGTPVAEFCSYFTNGPLLFDLQILGVDTNLLTDPAYQQLTSERIKALNDLASSMATAGQIESMFLAGHTDAQIHSVVAANRAPRFAGQTGLIASYYKAAGADFGYFGQTPEDFAIRQSVFADAPCVRGDALPVPGTSFSMAYQARTFGSEPDALAYHDSQPTAAQEAAHAFDQLLLLVDDEFATGEVRGNYLLRLAEGQNVPGYQVWLVRNLVAYSTAFYDHSAPYPDAVIDPASEIWQRLKTGGTNVSQQFLAGIDSDEPWPAFSVPEPWLP